MYTSFFGFTDNPFNDRITESMFILSESHHQALESIFLSINAKKGIITITGAEGTGKTILLRYLIKHLYPNIETILIFNTDVTIMGLLKIIVWHLNIPNDCQSISDLLKLLEQCLIEKQLNGKNVVLIIDNACNLPVHVLEEIYILSSLETDKKEKLLQIVLVGEPSLTTKLKSNNLKHLIKSITTNCYLQPLDHHECKQYISYRLAIAGCRDNYLFSQKSLEIIYNYSKGIPTAINTLCERALQIACEKKIKRIEGDIIEEAIAASVTISA